MADITWKGGTGDFNTGSFWSSGAVPAASDTAVVDASSGTASITLDDNDSVAGLTLNDPAGSLTLSGALSLNGGVLNLQAGSLTVSGTLSDGTLIPDGGVLTVSGPSAALLGVTVEGTLDLSKSGAAIDVTGIARPGLQQLDLGANTQLTFLDPEDFQGQTIEMAGGVLATDDLDPNNGSLFFGPGTEIIQNAASTTALIGPDTYTSLFGLGQVTNEGTLIAAAGTLDLDSEGGAFDSVLGQGPFLNDGTIEIGAGATVIDDTNSSLAGLGTIINNGGLLDLKGTLTNISTTIDVKAPGSFSNLQLDDTVVGGAIDEAGGTLAIGTGSLLGVTLEGTGVAFNTLTIGRGTEFDPGGAPFTLTALAAGYGQIYLNNGAVLANARLAYGAGQFQADLFVQGGTSPADRANPVATLAASTTLDVGSGQFLRLDAGQNGTLVNDAVINVAAGGWLEFYNAASYVAGGTINLAPGAIVVLDGGTDLGSGLEEAGLTGIGLAGLTGVVGSGATLVNEGSLNLDGQTISAAGNANFSKFVNEGEIGNGTFVLAPGQDQNLGQIDTGTTLATGPGVYPVDSATMAGGVLQGAVQLDTDGDIEVEANTSLASATGTGPGTLIIDQQPSLFVMGVATSMQIRQSATLSNAVVLLSGATTATATSAFSHADAGIVVEGYQTLTLAPNTEIIETTVNGPLGALGGPGYIVNDGTIAVTPGADLMVSPYASAAAQNFINNGLITIAAGGTLDAYVQTSIQSLGSIVGPGGLLRLDDAFNGTNTYVNTGNTITVGGTTGAPNLELDNTSITGGTIVNAGGQFTSVLGNLIGVTYVGPLDLTSGTDYLGNTSVGFLGFTGGTLDSQSVTLSSGSELILGMSHDFVGATLSLGGELADTGNTLGFDANTTVDITGSVYMPVGHLLNAGTIVIGPGASLQLADSGSASGPEASEPGTIYIDDGSFSPGVLNAGQTVILGPDSTFSASRFDPGSDVVFAAPNTLTINSGTTFEASASVSAFGVGDTILLSGYQDGSFAPYIYGNDGVTHIADPTISFGYDGNILTVTRSSIANGGPTTIATIPVGAGYVLSGFTATPLAGLAGGLQPPLLVNEYAITYAPPGVAAPSLPVISGTVAKQPTTDRVAIDPFANVSITDLNTGAVDTAIVTTYGTVPSGGINYVGTAPTGAFSNLGIGTTIDNGMGYIVSGTPAAVQAALDGLVFTPITHQTGPGQTVTTGFTIALNDQFGAVTDTTASVLATAVEDPILVSGVTSPDYVNNNVNAAQPFHNIVLSDPDNASFTATATLASTTYLAFSRSYGATISANGIWSTSGSLAFVQTALQGLVAYVNSVPPGPSGTTATTTMSMSINDGAADTVTAVSTIDIVSGGSIVAGGIDILGATPGQTTSDQAPIDPFAVVAIEDANVGVVDTVTVTMSNAANGTFSDAVGGTVNGGTFTVTGTPDLTQFGLIANIDTALAGLVFTPTRGQVPAGQSVTTWFTIVVNDGTQSATDASSSVIATDAGGQLAISGAQANQEFAANTPILPFGSVTIFDSQPLPNDTLTVTLSNPASGTLTANDGGTIEANGAFQIAGSPTQVQAALQAVGFTPAAAALGQMVSTTATISVTDGTLSATNTVTSLDAIGISAGSIVVQNSPAVAGLISTGPALTMGTAADSFVLNLGTVQAGTAVAAVVLDALNTAVSPADALDGSFVIDDVGGFINSGFAGFGTLAAGGSVAAGTITLETTQAGTFSETITLTPSDVGTFGSLTIEQLQTVTVLGTVLPVAGPASLVLNSSTAVVLPNVHIGATDQEAVSITNGATVPAATLSVMPAASGEATATGTIVGLAAGATDASDLQVGIDTSAAGTRDGAIALAGTSVPSNGTATVLANAPTIDVSGDVFRLASGTVAPASAILHVGDSGTLALSVVNTAFNDGYSEALIASLGTLSGVAAGASGPSNDIAPGGTNTSLSIVVPTATAGTDIGSAAVTLVSDGGSGAGSIDGLGTTALGTVSVPVSVTVDNAATAEVTASGPGLIPTFLDVYALDLGTVTAGAAGTAVVLDAANAAAAPGDALDESFSVRNGGSFLNAGFVNITSLVAGGTVAAGTISIDTSQPGIVTETIIATPTGVNASGYSQTQAAQEIDVVATVVAAGSIAPVENLGTSAIESSGPPLTAGGNANSFVLDLGTVVAGTASASVMLTALNMGVAPADSLDDSFAVANGGAFINSGFADITDLAAGSPQVAGTVELDTTQSGTVSETIVLTPIDLSNAGTQVETAQTITVLGTVLPAAPVIGSAEITLNSAGTIEFPNVRVGTPEQQAVSITNSGIAPAGELDVTPVVYGAATASGTVTGLAAGGMDATDIIAGLNTGTAGSHQGVVTLDASSVNDGTVTPLASAPTIAVSGDVYRQAVGTVAPVDTIVHAGDSAVLPLVVSNQAANDGYSEALTASILATSGDIIGTSSGATGDILAGETNAAALSITLSTAAAGVDSGSVTVGLTSDGGTGADSIDALGQGSLGTIVVPVNVTVDNYATAAVHSPSALLTPGSSPDSYVLNFGTVQAGAVVGAVSLDAMNIAGGPADALDGSYSVSSSAAFSDGGFAAFANLAAGSTLAAGTVSLNTSQTGSFSQTITLDPTDVNTTGFSQVQAPEVVTVMADIVPAGSAQGDVHMVTFDGRHYDFQAIGGFTLARSTMPGDTFDIQIQTVAAPWIGAVSVTSEVAAQVGGDIVTFGTGAGGFVAINGVADTTLNAGDPVQVLDGGDLRMLSPGAVSLTWATGESLTVTNSGPYLNSSIALPSSDGPGSVQGLLGGNSGEANDFQLPDGSVLGGSISNATLYGVFADAWQVTPADSMLGTEPMRFIASDGGVEMQATAAGQILSGGPGVSTLSDAGGYGVTFAGSVADLAQEAISGLTAKDVIDVTDLDSACASISYSGSASDGMLYVTDGVHSGDIHLSGQIPDEGFRVVSDMHGGSVLSFE